MLSKFRTEPYDETEVREAVQLGSAWLDEMHPGWAKKIYLPDLNMSRCDQCIIGQAVGNYYDVVTGEMGYDDDWAMENGFCAPNFYLDAEGRDFDLDMEYKYYRDLEILWTGEVMTRRFED